LFFASQHYLGRAYFGRESSWSEALEVWMACAYSWALLTPATLWLIERFPIDGKSWNQALLAHIPAAAFFSLFVLHQAAVIETSCNAFSKILSDSLTFLHCVKPTRQSELTTCQKAFSFSVTCVYHPALQDLSIFNFERN
jgi:hypothetical protein